MTTTYNATEHHRQRAWRLERDLAATENLNSKLVRLLTLALEVAHPQNPLMLGQVLEDLDTIMQAPTPAPVTEAELIALLNGTWSG